MNLFTSKSELIKQIRELKKSLRDEEVAHQQTQDELEERTKDLIETEALSDERWEELEEAKKELKGLKPKLRKRNEADLLLVSMRLQKRILAGEAVKQNDPMVKREYELRDQVSNMQNNYQSLIPQATNLFQTSLITGGIL